MISVKNLNIGWGIQTDKVVADIVVTKIVYYRKIVAEVSNQQQSIVSLGNRSVAGNSGFF